MRTEQPTAVTPLPPPSPTRPLPKLADLHADPESAFKNDQLKQLLNNPPSQHWLKKHPMAKTKDDKGNQIASSYLPVDKVEMLLDMIFQEWRIEVLNACQMFQSIAVTVRLHYKNPITGEWSFHDGVGAKSVQVDAGASAADLSKVKDAGVQMALPSAKSYAIKDAADHLGKIFGRDLNRQGTIDFVGKYSEIPAPDAPKLYVEPVYGPPKEPMQTIPDSAKPISLTNLDF